MFFYLGRITNGVPSVVKLFQNRAFTCEFKWVIFTQSLPPKKKGEKRTLAEVFLLMSVTFSIPFHCFFPLSEYVCLYLVYFLKMSDMMVSEPKFTGQWMDLYVFFHEMGTKQPQDFQILLLPLRRHANHPL